MYWEVWVEKGESHLNTIHGQGIVYCPPLSSWLACVRISNLKSSSSSSSTKNGEYSWSIFKISFRRLYFPTLCVLKCFLANDQIDSMHIHHCCSCKVFRLCDFSNVSSKWRHGMFGSMGHWPWPWAFTFQKLNFSIVVFGKGHTPDHDRLNSQSHHPYSHLMG